MKINWKFYVSLGLVFGFLGAFLVYPLLYVIQGSVWVEQDGKRQFTLIFFKLFGESPLMWKCLLNSLFLASATTLICALIAMPLAHLFVRYDFRWKPFWQTMLMAPLILPPFVGAIGVQQLFGRFGVLNHVLGLVGPNVLHPHPIDWLARGSFFGMILLQSLHLFPIFFLNLCSTLANISSTTREAARSLGASPIRVFRTITFPLMMPGIFAGAVIVFIWAFTDLGTPLIFGFYHVAAVQIFDKVTETGFNPFGYTLVIIVLLITLILFLSSRRLVARRDYVTDHKTTLQEALIPLSGMKSILVLFLLGFLCCLALLPHGSVILQSLSGKWFMSALPQEWTTKHYREIFVLPQTVTGLKNSFLYSSLSAFLDVLLGVTIAYWLARKKFVGKSILDALTVLPLALPGIVLAFGYVAGFNIPSNWGGVDMTWLKNFVNPRDNPMFLLMISYSVRRLPYMVRMVQAGLQQMSLSLEEASHNLGASRFMTMRRIVLPLLKGNIFAGAVLAFAFAFLEVSDSLILAMKEHFYPMTKTIWALMGRIEPGASSIASALGVLGMFLLLLAFYVANRWMGKKMGNLFG